MKKIISLMIAMALIVLNTTSAINVFADENMSLRWVQEPIYNFESVNVMDYRFNSLKLGYNTNGFNQYAIVKVQNKYGLIDYTGKYLVNPQFDSKPVLCICSQDNHFMVDNKNYWGSEGNAILSGDDLGHFIPDYPILNSATNQIGSLAGDSSFIADDMPPKDILRIIEQWDLSNGIIAKTGKLGIAKNNTIIVNPKYDFIYNFHEGMAGVKLNNLCGFINEQGNEVIPCQYEYVGSFVNGIAPVKKDGKAGYIDKTGKCVSGMNYEETRPLDIASQCGWVKKDGKWGVIEFVQSDLDKEILNVVDNSLKRRYEVMTAWDYNNTTAPKLKDYQSEDLVSNSYHIIRSEFSTMEKIAAYVGEYTSANVSNEFLRTFPNGTKQQNGALYLLEWDPYIPSDCSDGLVIRKNVMDSRIVATITARDGRDEVTVYKYDIELVKENGKWKLNRYESNEGFDGFFNQSESSISQEEREKRTIIFAQSLYDSMKLKDSISELEEQIKLDLFNIKTMRDIEVVNTYNRVYLDIAGATLDSAVTAMKIAVGDYGEAYDAIVEVGKEIEKGLVKDGFIDVATATMDVSDYVYSTAETAFYKQNNTYVEFVKCITDIRKEGMTYLNAVEFVALYSEFYINSAGIYLGFEYFNNQMPHNDGETIKMVLQSLSKEGFLILGDEVLSKFNINGEYEIFLIDLSLEIFNVNSEKYDPAFDHYAQKINRLIKATSNIVYPLTK